MRNTKRCFHHFSLYDRTSLIRFLEKQSEAGWLITNYSGFGVWTFRHTEPKKRHFSVVYFPKAVVPTQNPTAEQQEYIAFCQYTGWELLLANAQLHIFCSEFEAPVPIETDPVLEVENINQTVSKYLPANKLSWPIIILDASILWYEWLDLGSDIWRSPFLSFFIINLCLALIAALDNNSFIKWYQKARYEAEEYGAFTNPPRHTTTLRFVLTVCLVMMSILLLFFSNMWLGTACIFIALMTIISTIIFKRKIKQANLSPDEYQRIRGIFPITITLVCVLVVILLFFLYKILAG